MSIQTFPKTHSRRRLRRRAERVRQHYENKSTPRARWINTGQPCWGLPAHQLQQLFLQIPLKLQTSAAFVDFSLKNARTLKRCKHICSVDTLICGFNRRKMSSGRKAEQHRHFVQATHHYLDLAFAHLQVVLIVDIHPLQGTAHPLVRSHKEHNCKPTCRIRKRDQIEALQTSRRWQTRHQNRDSGDSGAQSCMHTARYLIIL